MAFPTVSSVEEFEFGNSDPIVLASAPTAGELIVLCLMSRFDSGAHSAVGYTAIANTLWMTVLYRINDGSESTSIDVTWSEEQFRVAYAVRVSGNHSSQTPEGVAASDGGSAVASIAAPTVTPSWSSADTLWLAFAGAQGGNTGVTYPLPDDQDVHVEPDVSVTAAMCSDGVATGSLSPGNWAFSPSWFRASVVTVAVRPVSGPVQAAASLGLDLGITATARKIGRASAPIHLDLGAAGGGPKTGQTQATLALDLAVGGQRDIKRASAVAELPLLLGIAGQVPLVITGGTLAPRARQGPTLGPHPRPGSTITGG